MAQQTDGSPGGRLEVQGAVARVIFDNPRARNGLTGRSAALVAELIRKADADPAVRVIIITGAGQHFCSGADLREGPKELAGGAEAIRRHVSEHFHGLVRAIAECETPNMAVIRGACVGFGFDLMLHCDLRLCATTSKFGQVFKRIGLVPDGGSSYMLPRVIGLGRAMELMLLAETFDGARALELGLVNRCIPDSELDALAEDWAQRLAQGPPIAYRLGRRNLRLSGQGGLEQALEREVESQVTCLTSKDMLRGVQAFFGKKTPQFKGD